MKIDVSVVSAPRMGKPISEDTFGIIHEPSMPFFAAVVDGHGPGDPLNRETAEFSTCVRDHLMRFFREHPFANALQDMFEHTQQEVARRFDDLPFGAVATCIIVDDQRMTIAHAGDCRVYRFKLPVKDDPYAKYGVSAYTILTADHCVENKHEMKRLRPFYDSGRFAPIAHDGGGCWLDQSNAQRLHYRMADGSISPNFLAPTRGFGDPDFRPAFTHVPEICFTEVARDQDSLFALCSDGGSHVVEQSFDYMGVHGGISDFDQVASTFKMSMPDKPRDDITVILFRLSPVVSP